MEAAAKLYTISQLNKEVQDCLRQWYSSAVWVQGEIKNYNRNAHRNHIFFELCEKDPDSDKILARVTAVIFEGVKPKIKESLARAGSEFQLQDDIEVKLECVVDLYPASGSYQLKIVNIDPVYTFGRIAQRRHAVLEALKKEGLLEKNKTLAVPRVPLDIGLITSYQSAAYHDFLKELQESHYAFRIFHVDARMQGQLAEQDVCRGIALLNRQSVDVIVMIRGGGSRSDLSWFDNLGIGRAVAHSRIPIFTGLGHEIDLSVTDLAAHTYQKTPTAVAHHLVVLVSHFLEQLRQTETGIMQRSFLFIGERKKRLSDLNREAVRSSQDQIQRSRKALQEAAWGTQHVHNQWIRGALLHLKSASERIGIKSVLRLKDSFKRVEQSSQRFSRAPEMRLRNSKARVEMMALRCKANDPVEVLKRGFTFSLDSRGKIIRRISAVRTGDVLTTILADGRVRSRVTEKRRIQEGEDPLAQEKVLL